MRNLTRPICYRFVWKGASMKKLFWLSILGLFMAHMVSAQVSYSFKPIDFPGSSDTQSARR